MVPTEGDLNKINFGEILKAKEVTGCAQFRKKATTSYASARQQEGALQLISSGIAMGLFPDRATVHMMPSRVLPTDPAVR
eukprot:scaffold40748_cov17-Prasinocladus_malaysianus.AAC.1